MKAALAPAKTSSDSKILVSRAATAARKPVVDDKNCPGESKRPPKPAAVKEAFKSDANEKTCPSQVDSDQRTHDPDVDRQAPLGVPNAIDDDLYATSNGLSDEYRIEFALKAMLKCKPYHYSETVDDAIKRAQEACDITVAFDLEKDSALFALRQYLTTYPMPNVEDLIFWGYFWMDGGCRSARNSWRGVGA